MKRNDKLMLLLEAIDVLVQYASYLNDNINEYTDDEFNQALERINIRMQI